MGSGDVAVIFSIPFGLLADVRDMIARLLLHGVFLPMACPRRLSLLVCHTGSSHISVTPSSGQGILGPFLEAFHSTRLH